MSVFWDTVYRRGLLHRLKTTWTFVHKRLKIGLEFLPTFSILFRPQFIAHALYGINVAPHRESKWNGIGFVCSSDSKPQKDFNLAMALRGTALSGNASLIDTFSSFF